MDKIVRKDGYCFVSFDGKEFSVQFNDHNWTSVYTYGRSNKKQRAEACEQIIAIPGQADPCDICDSCEKNGIKHHSWCGLDKNAKKQ